MAKLDEKRVRIFDRAVQPYLNQLATAFRQKNLKKLGELAGDQETLLLLKSQKVYHGKDQIIAFWKQLAAQGVTSVCFDVQKTTARPVDFLLGAADIKGVFTLYDMRHYSFGTFAFAGKEPNPGSFMTQGAFALVNGHPVTCQRDALMMVLDY